MITTKSGKKTGKSRNLSSWKRGMISLKGVSQNNLKDFDIDLPLGKLIVVTGPSAVSYTHLTLPTKA